MKKSRFSDFGPRNRAFTSHRSLLDSNRSFLDSSVMDHVLPIDGSLDFPGVALPPICDKASFVTKPGTFTGAIADPALTTFRDRGWHVVKLTTFRDRAWHYSHPRSVCDRGWHVVRFRECMMNA